MSDDTIGQEVALFDPSMDAGSGLDQLDGGDHYKVPFIKQLQSGSDELKRSKGAFIPGATEGDFINSMTLENYGQTVTGIVCNILPRVVEWRPEFGGIEAVYEPSKAPSDYVLNEKRKMVRKNGNTLEPTYYYYFMVLGESGPQEAVMPFKATGINDAKKYQAQFKAMSFKEGPARGQSKPTFLHVVEFKASPRASRDYAWMGTSMRVVGDVKDPVLYNRAKAFHAAAPTKVPQMKQEEDIVEGESKVVEENGDKF